MKKIVLVVLLLVGVAVAAWLLIAPAPLLAPRPEWTVVEGPQNAWHDYHRLAGEARAKKPVDFGELVKSASKPASQRFYKPPVVSPTDIPYTYRDEKELGQQAAAEATRLLAQGKVKESLALALATYKMGTDLAEPGCDLAAALAAIAVRRQAAAPLEALLQDPRLTADQVRAVGAQLQALDARMPTPGQVVVWEREALARGLEESLAQEAPGVAGLRVRMLNSVQQRLLDQEEVLRKALDSWDPAAAARAQEEANQIRTRSAYLKEAVPSLDTNLVSAQRQFYLDRVQGFGLESLAVIALAVRQSKKLPESLSDAPADPRTSQPPTYKREAGEALLLYPGPDGKDDGGKQAVDPNKAEQDSGRDIVFRYKLAP